MDNTVWLALVALIPMAILVIIASRIKTEDDFGKDGE